ncbi:hypothetical protein BBJ28_00005000 [Nothophytophthora sp. Chile5]|nr:hypothetical protein BBJ28_00005000 [Nothophytophthora sp. Chile5]
MRRAGDEVVDSDADDSRAVERRRVEYLRRHRELIQQRQRLETVACIALTHKHARRVEELEVDAASMRIRRDEVVAAKRAEEQSAAGAGVLAKLKLDAAKTRQLPGIYAHFDELGTDSLLLLAGRQQTSDIRTQLNTRGKYHVRYMKDAYPIAGAQLKLERERDMALAAKKKLLLQDSTSLLDTKAYANKRSSGGFLSADLQGARARSKLDFYEGKLATALQVQQEQVRQAEADRQIRLNALGETALQFCARYGLQGCAKLLLTHKGDPFARDRNGKSAVQYAHDNHHERLSQLLLNYDAVERTRVREKKRQQTAMLLSQKRGALAATWSQTREPSCRLVSPLRIV